MVVQGTHETRMARRRLVSRHARVHDRSIGVIDVLLVFLLGLGSVGFTALGMHFWYFSSTQEVQGLKF